MVGDTDGNPGADGSGDASAERPLGLGLLIWLLGCWAGAAALFLLMVVVGEGPLMLSGRSVPRAAARAAFLPILAPMALAAGAAALALALKKPWGRATVFLPILLAALTPVFTGAVRTVWDVAETAVTGLGVAALLAWYLYGRLPVTAYYTALRARRRERMRGPEA